MEVLIVLRRSFFMNVFIRRVSRRVVVISFTRKDEVLMRGRDPKNGYWEIVWTRKTDGVKVISGALHKKTAERIAAVLNALSKMEAKELVTTFRT